MNAPAETLVNALAMLCPFEPNEKQALLEAPGWDERVSIAPGAARRWRVSASGSNTVNWIMEPDPKLLEILGSVR